jgi:hypothetical protein
MVKWFMSVISDGDQFGRLQLKASPGKNFAR